MARRSKTILIGLPALAIIALAGAAYSISKNEDGKTSTKPRSSSSSIQSTSEINTAIGAVGIVEPSSQNIHIGTNRSGIIDQIFVSVGSYVKKGDPIFEIDSRTASAQLLLQHRALDTANARLVEKQSLVPELRAKVEIAQYVLNAAEAQYRDVADLVRIASKLQNTSSISGREKYRRNILLQRTKAKLSEAKAKLKLANVQLSKFDEDRNGASIAVQKALLEQSKAAVDLAQLQKQLSIVLAPSDGTILQLNISIGEYATAGSSQKPLVVFGKTDPLHVRVDIDEIDIPNFKPGSLVTASIRGVQNSNYNLTLVRIEPLVVPKYVLSGQIEERVDTRVLQALYRFNRHPDNLYPGQLVDVLIHTEKEKSLKRLSMPMAEY